MASERLQKHIAETERVLGELREAYTKYPLKSHKYNHHKGIWGAEAAKRESRRQLLQAAVDKEQADPLASIWNNPPRPGAEVMVSRTDIEETKDLAMLAAARTESDTREQIAMITSRVDSLGEQTAKVDSRVDCLAEQAADSIKRSAKTLSAHAALEAKYNDLAVKYEEMAKCVESLTLALAASRTPMDILTATPVPANAVASMAAMVYLLKNITDSEHGMLAAIAEYAPNALVTMQLAGALARKTANPENTIIAAFGATMSDACDDSMYVIMSIVDFVALKLHFHMREIILAEPNQFVVRVSPGLAAIVVTAAAELEIEAIATGESVICYTEKKHATAYCELIAKMEPDCTIPIFVEPIKEGEYEYYVL